MKCGPVRWAIVAKVMGESVDRMEQMASVERREGKLIVSSWSHTGELLDR
jgi:hypothetical protein